MYEKSVLCQQNSPVMEVAAANLREAGVTVTEIPTSHVGSLLLPVPSFSQGFRYLPPILDDLPPSVEVYGGNLDHSCLLGYHTVDFLKDPLYLAKNAAITARCAITLAGEIPKGAPVLVLGWGRIGKCLGKFLSEQGADVTISARKETDLALIEALGYGAIPVSALPEQALSYSCIFNTIPALVLRNPQVEPECVLLDLASLPGILGPQVISARGLPGKMAPEVSGKLIAETFLRLSKFQEV